MKCVKAGNVQVLVKDLLGLLTLLAPMNAQRVYSLGGTLGTR